MRTFFVSFNIIPCLLSIFICNAQKKESYFEIYGIIKGIGNSKVLLGNKPYGYNEAFKIRYFDSCYSKNDSFYFKGHVSEPDFYSVEVAGIGGWITFILENSKIKIRANKDDDIFHKSLVSGSKESDAWLHFEKNIEKPLIKKATPFEDQLDEAKLKNDSSRISLARDSIRVYIKKMNSATLEYIKQNPNNFISLSKLVEISHQINIATAKKYFSFLSKRLQNHSLGRKLYYNLFEKSEVIKINKPIPTFTLYDTSGRIVSSKNFKGKFILLDFWASWCGPCIEEFKTLKPLYQKYNKKGLEIIGISIDTHKDNWLKAVQQYSIPWLTLSDLKGSESKPYILFDIRLIPQLYLTDSSGKLLYKNIPIEKLSEILSDTFD